MDNNNTFSSFLKTGYLGVLKVGVSRFDIERILGKPEDRAYGKHPNSLHAYYNRVLQIGYDDDRISWYGIYFCYIKKNNLTILGCRIPINTEIAVSEFKSYLKKENIDFWINEELSLDDTVAFNIESNVVAFFNQGKIESIQVG